MNVWPRQFRAMKNCIYFIRDTGSRAVKIGVSADPKGRLKALQTASPTTLELTSWREYENATAVERYLHRTFAHLRCNGEWFVPDDALERVIAIAMVPEVAILLRTLAGLSEDGRTHLQGILNLGGWKFSEAQLLEAVLNSPMYVILLVSFGLKRLECGNPFWTIDGYPENCTRRSVAHR